jgi:hypothetical protein
VSDTTPSPPCDEPPRNDAERREKALINAIGALLRGDLASEYALADLIGHYRAEMAKMRIDLLEEMRIEKERCEHCKEREHGKPSAGSPAS